MIKYWILTLLQNIANNNAVIAGDFLVVTWIPVTVYQLLGVFNG
jgi:hypothetical protein